MCDDYRWCAHGESYLIYFVYSAQLSIDWISHSKNRLCQINDCAFHTALSLKLCDLRKLNLHIDHVDLISKVCPKWWRKGGTMFVFDVVFSAMENGRCLSSFDSLNPTCMIRAIVATNSGSWYNRFVFQLWILYMHYVLIAFHCTVIDLNCLL